MSSKLRCVNAFVKLRYLVLRAPTIADHGLGLKGRTLRAFSKLNYGE